MEAVLDVAGNNAGRGEGSERQAGRALGRAMSRACHAGWRASSITLDFTENKVGTKWHNRRPWWRRQASLAEVFLLEA